MASATSTTKMNGKTAFTTSQYGTLKVVIPMKMLRPKGGVIMPIATLSTIIAPKWTGSMLSALASGAISGVSTMIAELGSTNIPANRNSRLISSSTVKRVLPSIDPVMVCGTFSKVM